MRRLILTLTLVTLTSGCNRDAVERASEPVPAKTVTVDAPVVPAPTTTGTLITLDQPTSATGTTATTSTTGTMAPTATTSATTRPPS